VTVAQLIGKLKKMPQNVEVALSAQDNAEWEISDWVNSVDYLHKRDYIDKITERGDKCEKEMLASNPDHWVVIKG